MNRQERVSSLAQELFDLYEQHKFPHISSRRFNPAQLEEWLNALASRGGFALSPVGSSAEGRSISLLTVGNGTPAAFLWSQMHGDEPTATMALLDILHFIAREPSHPIVSAVTSQLKILILPMLNPDGAERFTRRTAQKIDMNRDALTLRTPEGRLLKSLREQYNPEFGFNLHDQDPRFSVGTTRNVAAISLLAPAIDPERNDNNVRARAKLVASLFAEAMQGFIPNNLTRYDETFEPRAFGDNIQKWGTSTVLVESGGWPNDPEKMYLRKLNFVGLLVSLHGIATGNYTKANPRLYEQLPLNEERFFDLIVRNVSLICGPRVSPIVVDVGINFDDKPDPSLKERDIPAKVMDIGDLSTFGAFEEIDGSGCQIHSSHLVLEENRPKGDLLALFE